MSIDTTKPPLVSELPPPPPAQAPGPQRRSSLSRTLRVVLWVALACIAAIAALSAALVLGASEETPSSTISEAAVPEQPASASWRSVIWTGTSTSS